MCLLSFSFFGYHKVLICNTMTSLETTRVIVLVFLASPVVSVLISRHCYSLSVLYVTGLDVSSVIGSLLRVVEMGVLSASPVVYFVRPLTVGRTSPGWLLPN